jgi:hypothetical protein
VSKGTGSQRLVCPHYGTPLAQVYIHARDGGREVHRRRECPRCAASYITREAIVATEQPPKAARGVPAQVEARP